jgi:hypothetical protein
MSEQSKMAETNPHPVHLINRWRGEAGPERDRDEAPLCGETDAAAGFLRSEDWTWVDPDHPMCETCQTIAKSSETIKAAHAKVVEMRAGRS